jgi:hypothetical protein
MSPSQVEGAENACTGLGAGVLAGLRPALHVG